MGTQRASSYGGNDADDLLTLYDEAVPHVYGYLLSRSGRAGVAEDLTAETFLAAVEAVRSGRAPLPLTVGWLVGVARHKLVDHWRRQAREERNLRAVADAGDRVGAGEDADDTWDRRIDALRARDVLEQLAVPHRTVLTMRYVDDLPVPQVAELLGRSLHATEALLVRARAAFRRAYDEEGNRD